MKALDRERGVTLLQDAAGEDSPWGKTSAEPMERSSVPAPTPRNPGPDSENREAPVMGVSPEPRARSLPQRQPIRVARTRRTAGSWQNASSASLLRASEVRSCDRRGSSCFGLLLIGKETFQSPSAFHPGVPPFWSQSVFVAAEGNNYRPCRGNTVPMIRRVRKNRSAPWRKMRSSRLKPFPRSALNHRYEVGGRAQPVKWPVLGRPAGFEEVPRGLLGNRLNLWNRRLSHCFPDAARAARSPARGA